MSALSTLLGGTLQTKNGPLPTAQVLEGKTKIGIYFSASWCGPCHHFTPILAKAYKELQDSGLEVVFVSSDQDSDAFEKYYVDMPWAAIPFDKLEGIKNLLKQKFDVQGIPTLVVVDADANLITTGARTLIDKYGSKAFPFTAEHVAGLSQESRKEAAAALKTLASEHLQDVLGSGTSAKVVCLVLGQPDRNIDDLVSCVPKLEGKEPGPFEARYIPWEEKEDEDGHTLAAKGLSKLPVSEEAQKLIAKVCIDPVEPPQLLVVGKKTDGEWEVLSADAYTPVRKYGVRAYPWTEEIVKACDEEDEKKAAELKGKLSGLELLKSERRAELQRGVGVAKKEEAIADVAAANEIVGLYFSAHWCGPCRAFTPKLVQMYEELRASGKKFEVVFISSDKDQEKFDEYFGSMPWLALPFAERDLKAQLGHKACFNVRGIPTLVLINVKTGKVLEADSWAAVEIGAESWPFDEESIAAGKAKAEAKAKAGEEESCRKQEEVSGAKMVMRRKTGKVGGCTVDAEARVVSCAGFFTVAAENLLVPKGEKAYYELEIKKCESICQVGWANPDFAPDFQCGDGVGDCDKSWGFDGIRKCKWNAGDSEFGSEWKAGDVIGISVDLSESSAIACSVNGSSDAPNGTAFEGLSGVEKGVYPALTLTPGFVCAVNFGEKPFKFPPAASFKPLSAFA